MRFASTWLRFAARRTGRPLWGSLKSVALRHLEHKRPAAASFKDRLMVFAKLHYMVLSLPFRMRRDPSKSLLLLNVPDRSLAERLYFIRKFDTEAPEEAAIAHYDPARPVDRLVYRRMTLRKVFHLLQASWLIWWGGFFHLFSRVKARPEWHIFAAQLLHQQILFHDPDSRIIFFFCYYAQTYLSSYVASAILGDYQPIIVASNSILFENNRYLYHPDLRLQLCSRLQVPEVENYRALGWMQLKEAPLWGLEEVHRIDTVPPSAPTLDIGLFSSGFWARTENGWRVSDIEAVRRGDYHGNRWFLIFRWMLEVVAELKQERPALTVKVYLHPHERRLLADHGIAPPYLPLLQANGFLYNLEGEDSLQKFYEARIGLSSQSTIVFDRIHYGLPGFFYAGKERWQPIAPQYLGEYAAMGFQSREDLKAKLRACLG
jgi:hypothetical protein